MYNVLLQKKQIHSYLPNVRVIFVEKKPRNRSTDRLKIYEDKNHKRAQKYTTRKPCIIIKRHRQILMIFPSIKCWQKSSKSCICLFHPCANNPLPRLRSRHPVSSHVSPYNESVSVDEAVVKRNDVNSTSRDVKLWQTSSFSTRYFELEGAFFDKVAKDATWN